MRTATEQVLTASDTQDDNSASKSGAVYMFTRTDGVWSQQAYIKASNTDRNDNFGVSAALTGNTLAVSAPGEDSNGTGVNSGAQADNSAAIDNTPLLGGGGAVYVFTRSENMWSQNAYIKASNPQSGDGFGGIVALSGATLAVGAAGEASNGTGINNGAEDDNSANDSGAVYVFQ